MKPRLSSILVAGALWAWWYGAGLAADQPQDLVSAVKKATKDLADADNAVVQARNRLAAARRQLNPSQFNSAAYNARVTAQQQKAAKEKYEKAKGEQAKEQALELYQLAQELAAQREKAFEAAKKVLPQREKQAQAAEEKYSTALAEAQKAAGQIKSLVRQTDNDALAKLKASKLATEKAAFAQATAEQSAAEGEQIRKTMAELTAADKALQQTAAALKEASEKDRPQKLEQSRKAVTTYANALHTAAEHVAALKSDQIEVILKATGAVVEADKAVQSGQTVLQQAQQNLQNRVNAVKQAEKRVKSAEEAVKNRIAKIRAKKDLEREKAALERALAAKAEAEKQVPPKEKDALEVQKQLAEALEKAVQTLAQASGDQKKSLDAARDAIAKAIAEKEARIKKQNETLAQQAAEAQKAAEKAKAAVDAADKLAAGRQAVRQALLGTLRKRFYRQASTAMNEQRQREAALGSANKELQKQIAALNKATFALKQAKENAAKAQKNAAAQAMLLKKATQQKQAAEKAAKEKQALANKAEQTAKQAQAAARAAQEAFTAASESEKEAAQKKAKEREAAAKAAAQKAKQARASSNAAQAALEKAQAALSAAEKRANETARAAQEAKKKAVAAQEAVSQATDRRNKAQQTVQQRRESIQEAVHQRAVAKAGAYGGLKPLAHTDWDYAKARHLLLRAGFGGTPEEVGRLHEMGLHRAVSHLVHFTEQPPPDIAFVAHPKQRPENYESALSGDERRRLRNQRVARDRRQMQNMRAWWLERMVTSPRPLEEKLTLFWHGQIPSAYSDVGDSYYMYLQNQLFRDHAAGNFGTILYGIAHDAAMLKYLNNDTNVKGHANENLAREIMELFSMGRDQGYTETDVKEGARALTGYTYDSWTGQFRFVSKNHDTDPKTIFGNKTGNFSGGDFVRLILQTPYPPKFIAKQMFVFFAHEAPSNDTIEALANVLRQNNYELATMLENLFLSEEFYSERSMGAQIKGPVQLVVGLHRDLGLKNADYVYLASAVRGMGQDLFEPPTVFGWQGGRSWITSSRTFARYNTLAEILERRPRGGQRGVEVVGTLLAGKEFQNHAEVVDYLVKCCLIVPISEGKRQALIEFLGDLPAPAEWEANPGPVNARLTRLLVMLACSPEYQLF